MTDKLTIEKIAKTMVEKDCLFPSKYLNTDLMVKDLIPVLTKYIKELEASIKENPIDFDDEEAIAELFEDLPSGEVWAVFLPFKKSLKVELGTFMIPCELDYNIEKTLKELVTKYLKNK